MISIHIIYMYNVAVGRTCASRQMLWGEDGRGFESTESFEG
jgi:hypothetical protein